jgi:hypothetical protein
MGWQDHASPYSADRSVVSQFRIVRGEASHLALIRRCRDFPQSVGKFPSITTLIELAQHSYALILGKEKNSAISIGETGSGPLRLILLTPRQPFMHVTQAVVASCAGAVTVCNTSHSTSPPGVGPPAAPRSCECGWQALQICCSPFPSAPSTCSIEPICSSWLSTVG